MARVTDEALITVTENGPYRVDGGLPIHRAQIAYSEFGEPLAWEEGPDLGGSESYDLCRCGRSSRKPYCDGTHELIDFDGTETADRGPSEARRAVYEGAGLIVTDDVTLCTHAGFCTDRFTSIWELVKHTADPEVRRRVIEMASQCPSGRLQHSIPGEPGDELADQPSIGVEPDGPYLVRGGVPIVAHDGRAWETRNRVALCRCGSSTNKPFCDGTHERVGFRDAALPSGSAAERTN